MPHDQKHIRASLNHLQWGGGEGGCPSASEWLENVAAAFIRFHIDAVRYWGGLKSEKGGGVCLGLCRSPDWWPIDRRRPFAVHRLRLAVHPTRTKGRGWGLLKKKGGEQGRGGGVSSRTLLRFLPMW